MRTATVEDFYRDLPRLETARLVLRRALESDASDVFAYASDAQVARFLRWGPHQTMTETEGYIEDVLVEYREGRDGPWMIELKRNRRAIGHVHLMEISARHRKAQVGFVLSRAYWGRGIMTEALSAVLEYAFECLGLHRVEGLCVRENRAARRVLEKVGMTKEGALREYLYQKDRYWDFSLYGILGQEFSGRSPSDSCRKD